MKTLPLLLASAIASALASSYAVAQSAGVDGARTVAAEPLYIVTFTEPAVMQNTGQRSGFAATAPHQTGDRKLNVRAPAVVNYRNFLANQQDTYLSQMEGVLARDLEVVHRYDITLNGMAVRMTAAEAERVRSLAGVQSVEAEKFYELNTDAGPAFIGAPAIWSGSGTPNSVGNRGQGVLVGVFDSGANADHPSFANDASCGFSPANPKLVASKDCNTTNCASGNGEDVSIFVDAANPGSSGHGVHTASTAVGNTLTAGTLAGAVPAQFNISGVAPCARVISYKVCGDTLPTGFGSCRGSAITAAIQTSIIDQIDVMNYSISGGQAPWSTSDSGRGFLDMVNADIVVVAAAGNTRTETPDPVGAVNHRGPWVLTVANTSHNRVVTNPVSVAGSLQNVPSQAGNGGGNFVTTVTAQVASAAALGNAFGCTDTGGFAAGSMTGKIALIQRGPLPPGTACGFVEKINNAAAAGAVGAVIFDHSPGAPLTMAATGTTLPAIFIRRDAGVTLRDFIGNNPTAQMTVVAPAARVIDASVGDVLNASSLRGPNNTFDVTKPDLAAPGTNIYAASSDTFGQYTFLSGTSMASPHAAGAAALLRATHPSWTPQEVKSALQLTASRIGRKSDEVTPWNADDTGNGRADLNRAARSGLVMNETFANFLAADPAGGNTDLVRQLNIPSLRHGAVAGSYTFNRTFRNAYGRPVRWDAVVTGAPAGTTVEVTPATFSFGANPNQTQTVQIKVTLTQALAANTFGEVAFAPTVLTDPAVLFADGMEDPSQAPLGGVLTIVVKGNP